MRSFGCRTGYVPGDTSAWQDAILLLGPRKSGTTLLQSLLDGAGGLIVLPGEMKLKRLSDFESLDAKDRGEYYVSTGRSHVESIEWPMNFVESVRTRWVDRAPGKDSGSNSLPSNAVVGQTSLSDHSVPWSLRDAICI